MAPPRPPQLSLADLFGRIDIYVFDQLLRGNIAPGMRILDAGCGHGRNLVYLLRAGYEVFAADADPEAIASLRDLAAYLAPHLPAANFQFAAIEAMPFPDAFADVVLCNSVLHFARDEAHFRAMLAGLWRTLRPGGMLFCRLASTIGAESLGFQALGVRRYLLPDGADWFLVDEPMLLALTNALGGELVDLLKTTVVQDHRCMTTWVLRKN